MTCCIRIDIFGKAGSIADAEKTHLKGIWMSWTSATRTAMASASTTPCAPAKPCAALAGSASCIGGLVKPLTLKQKGRRLIAMRRKNSPPEV